MFSFSKSYKRYAIPTKEEETGLGEEERRRRRRKGRRKEINLRIVCNPIIFITLVFL